MNHTTLRAAPSTALGAAMLAATAGIAAPAPVMAQDVYVGQVIMGGWSFCPAGWAPAHGQLLPINQNQALFALLGTTFGGNGTTTFALPDLRGRVAVAEGTGVGLPPVFLGERGGQASVTLTPSQLPAHSHTISTTASGTIEVSSGSATATSAAGNSLSNAATGTYTAEGAPTISMRQGTVAINIDAATNPAGGSAPVNIRSPYLGLTYCIALQGIFPSQN